MNILIVTAMFPPIQTGTSFYSKNLAEALQNRGHNVTVITVKNKETLNGFDGSFKLEQISALRVPLNNYFKHLSFTSVFLGNYVKVYKIVRKTKSDIILLINHYLDIAFPAIIASKLLKIPIVCSVGTQIQSLNPIRDKILYILDKLICGKLIFQHCSKVVAWDSELKKYISEIHPPNIVNKTVIVPYGIHGNETYFNEHVHDYSNSKLILGVGAIIEQRNFLFLIRIFHHIVKQLPDVKLKIIGHIYYTAPIELAAELGLKDRITFTGELPHHRVLSEMKKSSIYCNMATGKFTGLGTASIEAMLMGIPVISNISSNLFEKPLLFDMQNFIFADESSFLTTCAKIERLLRDAKLRRKIGMNGRKFVSKYLNWNVVSKQMANVLNGTLSPCAGTGKITRPNERNIS